jgi:hypothetical protein
MMQPYMYILFWLITSHNLHSEKRPPPGLIAKMPVPSPTKRAVPDAAVVERLFRPLANYPVVGAVWQFKHGDVGRRYGDFNWFYAWVCLTLRYPKISECWLSFSRIQWPLLIIYIIYMIYWYTVCFYHISGPAVGGALHPLWSAELFLRHLWIHWRGPEGWRRDGGWKGGCQDAKRKNR